MKTECLPHLPGKTILAAIVARGPPDRGMGDQIFLVFDDGEYLEIYNDPRPSSLRVGGMEAALPYAVRCRSNSIVAHLKRPAAEPK